MKKRNNYIINRIGIILGIILICTTSRAGEGLGAFGIKLGQVMNNGFMNSILDDNGNIVYQIEVPKPSKYLSHYYVRITPISHQVYEILGVKFFGEGDNAEGKCNNLGDLISNIVKNKYKKQRNKSISIWAYCPFRHEYDWLSDNYEHKVIVRYFDKKLEKLAKKEREELAKSEDSSVF